MKDSSALADLNSLLDAQTETLLADASAALPDIQERLAVARSAYALKIQELGASTASAANAELVQKVLAAEAELTDALPARTLETADDLQTVSSHLFSLCPLNRKEGFYMTEEAARTVLEKLPPLNLLSFLETHTVPSLSTPLAQLAITRHTESQQWQEAYHAYLATLGPDAFEMRSMDFLCIDSGALAAVLDHSGQPQKPWRMSHSKEIGMINCFSLQKNHSLPAPMLQFAAVFFHYFFETAFASEFFKAKSEEQSQSLGSCIVAAITSHTSKTDYFHANTYSEHLFWEHALETLYAAFPLPSLSFFKETVALGSIEDGQVSLNLIDQIWNVNFTTVTSYNRYFAGDSTTFLYHFREAFWYELLLNISGRSRQEQADLVLRNLDMGDTALTPRLQL